MTRLDKPHSSFCPLLPSRLLGEEGRDLGARSSPQNCIGVAKCGCEHLLFFRQVVPLMN